MTYALACIAFSSSPIVTFVTSLAAVLFLPVLSRKWISRIRSPVPLLQYDKWYRKTYLYEYLTTLALFFPNTKQNRWNYYMYLLCSVHSWSPQMSNYIFLLFFCCFTYQSPYFYSMFNVYTDTHEHKTPQQISLRRRSALVFACITASATRKKVTPNEQYRAKKIHENVCKRKEKCQSKWENFTNTRHGPSNKKIWWIQ